MVQFAGDGKPCCAINNHESRESACSIGDCTTDVCRMPWTDTVPGQTETDRKHVGAVEETIKGRGKGKALTVPTGCHSISVLVASSGSDREKPPKIEEASAFLLRTLT